MEHIQISIMLLIFNCSYVRDCVLRNNTEKTFSLQDDEKTDKTDND